MRDAPHDFLFAFVVEEWRPPDEELVGEYPETPDVDVLFKRGETLVLARVECEVRACVSWCTILLLSHLGNQKTFEKLGLPLCILRKGTLNTLKYKFSFGTDNEGREGEENTDHKVARG